MNLIHQHNTQFILKSKQTGVATLFTTIILMFAVTMITLNASKLGVLELFISNNYESKQVAFNHAESTMDALYSVTDQIVDLNDSIGHTYCTTNNDIFDDDSCEEKITTATVGWPTDYSTAKHQAHVTYEGTGCPPRYLQSSCAALNVSHFTLRTVYDNRAKKGGKSETVLGAMVVSPVTE